MNRSVLIGALAVALLAPATTVTAQSDSSSDYSWAYVFAGQTQLLQIDVGPNGVVFKLNDITIDGQMAADARHAIDNLRGVGDGDGQITQEEIVGFEALATATINSQLPNQFDFEMITLDGKRAFSSSDQPVVSLTELDIKGAEGPTSSTEPIKTDMAALLRFESVSQSSSMHSVVFSNIYGDFTGFDSSGAPPSKVEVSAFRSWEIVAETVQPSELQERVNDDTIELTNSDFAYFDERGEGLAFTIKGDPTVQLSSETNKSPGIGPVSLIAALGVALVALRRRN